PPFPCNLQDDTTLATVQHRSKGTTKKSPRGADQSAPCRGIGVGIRHKLSKSSTELAERLVITSSSFNHLPCESAMVQSSGTIYAIYTGVKRTSRPVGECHETKGTDAMSWPVMFISSFVPIVLLFMLRIMDWLNGVFRSTATR